MKAGIEAVFLHLLAVCGTTPTQRFIAVKPATHAHLLSEYCNTEILRY